MMTDRDGSNAFESVRRKTSTSGGGRRGTSSMTREDRKEFIQSVRSRNTSYNGNGQGRNRKSYRKKRKKFLRGKFLILLLLGMVLVWLAWMAGDLVKHRIFGHYTEYEGDYAYVADRQIDDRPELDVELIEVNPYSRPGYALEEVKGIVVHYTANPGTTARQNRDYFAGLAEEKTTKASSHFVIGLDGEIVQCIPCNEIAYASNNRNKDTIAIECCHEDESGKFNEKTYKSLVELVCWLMARYDLNTEDVIRHYDVTEKICPKYYVDNPEAWEQFRQDITDYMLENGTKEKNK